MNAAILILCAVAQSPFVSTKTTRDKLTWSGSGVAYKIHDYGGELGNYMLVLSCAHSRELGDGVTLKFDDTQDYVGEVVAIDKTKDLSVIACKEWPTRLKRLYPIMPESDSLSKDDEVRVVGFGFQTIDRFSYSRKVDKRTKILEPSIKLNGWAYPLCQTVGDVRPGDSGGALFYHNHIAGIVACRNMHTGTNHDGGYVRHTEIWSFLKEFKLQP